jgi:hypothetical protein
MRSGASSVASAKKPGLQAAQLTQTTQISSTDSTKQQRDQIQAQILNLGLNIDYKA